MAVDDAAAGGDQPGRVIAKAARAWAVSRTSSRLVGAGGPGHVAEPLDRVHRSTVLLDGELQAGLPDHEVSCTSSRTVVSCPPIATLASAARSPAASRRSLGMMIPETTPQIASQTTMARPTQV